MQPFSRDDDGRPMKRQGDATNGVVSSPSPKQQKITWLSQLEWILRRPDSFLGPVSLSDVVAWTVREEEGGRYTAMEATASMSPALLVLLAEAVTNSLDNSRRPHSEQRFIKITIAANGTLTVENDGTTLPISLHDGASERWTPSVAFSEFNAGSNFEDDLETRSTAGRNGVGITAANAWSTEFEIFLTNAADKKTFSQRWEQNMSVVHEPCVKPTRLKRSGTSVRFKPDYTRLGMTSVSSEGLPDGVVSVLSSLAYHASICAPPSVQVWLNGSKVGIRTPAQYLATMGVECEHVATDEIRDGRQPVDPVMRIACAARAAEGGTARTEAFVNGVRCCEGSHVKMVVSKIIDLVVARARYKARDTSGLVIRHATVRAELCMVLVVLVPNPRFTSQLKTSLDTPLKTFGWSWEPSPSFCAAIQRSALVDRVISASREEQQRHLQRSTKHRTTTAVNVPKYEGATLAGKKGTQCSLLVTEGDSAKTLAVAGFSVVGRQRFGVFPILGKLPNAKKMAPAKLLANTEIASLIKIIGLEWGVEYDVEKVARLRYRNLIVFSDQDTDGAHIAGLICNFVHVCWPSLLLVWPDFVKRFATPIIRASPRGEPPVGFFSEVEFRRWKDARAAAGLPTAPTKYFKGLGTSNHALAREYFKAFDANTIKLTFGGEPCQRALRLFFDEKQSAERKSYLSDTYDPTSFVDYSAAETTMEQFLHNEMSHFSAADNVRSIPSAIDGLKVSQRKVLYSMLRMKPGKEVKVAAAMGTISVETCYHHGEASLAQTVVTMAQDFNKNCPLLVPEGMFGTRHTPKAAAPRYIFTYADPLTRVLFNSDDDVLLEYEMDDGETVEPTRFCPIIPVVLLNGAQGIGTGWSTSCCCFNPHEIVDVCELICSERETGGGNEASSHRAASLLPWYRGFTGSIVAADGQNGYVASGSYTVRGEHEVVVTELPPGKYTDDFCEHIRAKLVGAAPAFTSVVNQSTDDSVRVVLKSAAPLREMDLDKLLSIQTSISVSNITLFDGCGRLRRFTVPQIFEEHAHSRINLYKKRIAHTIVESEQALAVARNKRRFVEAVISGEVVLQNYADEGEAEEALVSAGFDRLPTFEYLFAMRITSMTLRRLEALRQQEERADGTLAAAREATPFSLWRQELGAVRVALDAFAARKAAR